jgi:hypothetical protein
MTKNTDFQEFDLEKLRRSLDLYMDRNAVFFYQGHPIENEKVIRLFHQHICFNAQTQENYIQIADQIAYFKTETVAFFVKSIESDQQSILLVLNTEERINIDQIERVYSENLEGIYLKLKDRRLCFVLRSAQQQLQPYLEQEGDDYFFDFALIRFPIKIIEQVEQIKDQN